MCVCNSSTITIIIIITIFFITSQKKNYHLQLFCLLPTFFFHFLFISPMLQYISSLPSLYSFPYLSLKSQVTSQHNNISNQPHSCTLHTWLGRAIPPVTRHSSISRKTNEGFSPDAWITNSHLFTYIFIHLISLLSTCQPSPFFFICLWITMIFPSLCHPFSYISIHSSMYSQYLHFHLLFQLSILTMHQPSMLQFVLICLFTFQYITQFTLSGYLFYHLT